MTPTLHIRDEYQFLAIIWPRSFFKMKSVKFSKKSMASHEYLG